MNATMMTRFIALVVMLCVWWIDQTPLAIAWFDKANALTVVVTFGVLYLFLLRFLFPGDDDFNYALFAGIISALLSWYVLFPRVTRPVETYVLAHDLLQGVIFLSCFVAAEVYVARIPTKAAVKMAVAALGLAYLVEIVLSAFAVHIGTPTHVRIYECLTVLMVLWWGSAP